MKKIALLLIIAFISINSFSQKKELTVEQAVTGQMELLYPGYIAGLKWQEGTENYTTINTENGYQSIMQSSAKSKKEVELITVNEVNASLTKQKLDSINHFYDYKWINKDIIKLGYDKRFVFYNIKTKKVEFEVNLPKEASDIFYCKENKTFAYTIENNLYITDSKGKQTQVTNDTDKNFVNGQTVSRSEFGITNGIFWSPKGNYLAFYRKDESKVTNYPIVNVNTTPATVEPTKYPMTGQPSENVTLGIYNIKTGKTHFLKTGEPNEQYLVNPTWNPNEKDIILTILNRGQNHAKINRYDVATGNMVKTLFEEKNDKWVEPEKFSYFISENEFIWQSERDGFMHMYLYTIDGELKEQITKGNWLVDEIKAYDKKTGTIYFTGTKNSPIENHLYSVNIKTKEIKTLTKEEGTHNCALNYNFKYFIDGYSSVKTPRVYNITSVNGKVAKNLVTAKNPLKEYNINLPEIGTIKAADGKTDLYYRLIKPSNFDENKKYPVIVYVYGGPHAQMVTNSWMAGASMWLYYMAQKGYVVFTVDNRGSAKRGFAFESVIHRQCGQEEMKDQMEGVKFLKSHKWVDTGRIGVDGWSYGGFMTTSLMLNHNETFKVGVAGGPVIDWKFYEVMYGERYMDTPQENPEGFEKTSLLNKTDKLKGRLLIIHGGIDPTVVWQNSLMFLNKCIETGTLIDYMVYPNHEHNVRGKDRIHLIRTIARYFDDHL